MTSIQEKLDANKNINWDEVSDRNITAFGIRTSREIKNYYKKLIEDTGVTFEGRVLDLFSGIYTFGLAYDNTVAVDNNLKVIKALTKNDFPAIYSDLLNTDLDKYCCDIAIATYPPRNPLHRSLLKDDFRDYSIEEYLLAIIGHLPKNALILHNTMPEHSTGIDEGIAHILNYEEITKVKDKHNNLIWILKR